MHLVTPNHLDRSESQVPELAHGTDLRQTKHTSCGTSEWTGSRSGASCLQNQHELMNLPDGTLDEALVQRQSSGTEAPLYILGRSLHTSVTFLVQAGGTVSLPYAP